jgi:hypothetical protein
MHQRIGLFLLSWSALSAFATLYAYLIVGDISTLIGKGLTSPAYTITLSGALDDDKLDAQCKQEFIDPPARDSTGHIATYSLANWLRGGAGNLVHQALQPVVFALGIGTLITAGCGIACFRNPGESQNPPDSPQ